MSTVAEIKHLYANAVSEYERGHYDAACGLFSHLSTMAPMQTEIWKGLAACQQEKKLYESAVVAWGVAAFLEPQDPTAYFHAAECLLAQGNRSQAGLAIRSALACTCPEPFLDKIILLKEVIDHA